jgi:hypothetical protein
MQTRALSPLAFLGLFFSLAACSGSAGSINVTSSAGQNPLSPGDPYVVAAGQGVVFSAAPVDSSGKPVSVTVSATADDSGIAKVYPTTTSNTFVVIGESLGTTHLRFSTGGDPPQAVVLNVVAQTAQ